MWRYTFVLLLLPTIVHAEPKPLPLDLRSIPETAAGFITIRWPELWQAPVFEPIRKRIGGDEMTLISQTVMGFNLDDIERVTMIVPTLDTAGAMIMDVPGDIHATILLHRFKKPLPKLPIVGILSLRGLPTETHFGQSYHVDGDGWLALYFLDERTYAISTRRSIRWLIEQQSHRPSPAYLAALHEVERSTLALHTSGRFLQHIAREAVPAVEREEIVPIFAADRITITSQIDKQFGYRLTADHANAANARAAGKAIDRVRALMLEAIDADIASMLESSSNRRAGEEPSENQREMQNLNHDTRAFSVGLKPKIIEQRVQIDYRSNRTMPLEMFAPGIGRMLWVGGPMAIRINLHAERDQAIATALEAYHRDHGCYPPPAIVSRTGKPLLSWRVALLPYLGAEAKQLYARFHLDEAWDSPHNRQWIAHMPWVYSTQSPNDYRPRPQSPYRIFVGPGTVMEGPQGIRKSAIRDGLDKTIIVVRGGYRSSPWTSPEELAFGEKLPPIGWGDSVEVGITAAGGVQPLNIHDTKELRGWLTRAGGEK